MRACASWIFIPLQQCHITAPAAEAEGRRHRRPFNAPAAGCTHPMSAQPGMYFFTSLMLYPTKQDARGRPISQASMAAAADSRQFCMVVAFVSYSYW
jgi:hypothetical protein